MIIKLTYKETTTFLDTESILMVQHEGDKSVVYLREKYNSASNYIYCDQDLTFWNQKYFPIVIKESDKHRE